MWFVLYESGSNNLYLALCFQDGYQKALWFWAF